MIQSREHTTFMILLRTPKQNTCGYDEIPTESMSSWGDYLRGNPGVSAKAARGAMFRRRSIGWHLASNFTWASDSSKIVFADYKSNTMSLVLVTMPTGTTDYSQTFGLSAEGPEDILRAQG